MVEKRGQCDADYPSPPFWQDSEHLKVLFYESYLDIPEGAQPKYELMLTNLEVKLMFQNMIRDWFTEAKADYNDFIKALLENDLDAMNEYMNRVAFRVFSYFDTGNTPSGAEPECFTMALCWGFWWNCKTDISLLPTGKAALAGMMWCWNPGTLMETRI